MSGKRQHDLKTYRRCDVVWRIYVRSPIFVSAHCVDGVKSAGDDKGREDLASARGRLREASLGPHYRLHVELVAEEVAGGWIFFFWSRVASFPSAAAL